LRPSERREPANDNFLRRFQRREGAAGSRQALGLKVRAGANHYGELQAWDPATGKKVWQYNFPKSHQGGVVWVFAVKK